MQSLQYFYEFMIYTTMEATDRNLLVAIHGCLYDRQAMLVEADGLEIQSHRHTRRVFSRFLALRTIDHFLSSPGRWPSLPRSAAYSSSPSHSFLQYRLFLCFLPYTYSPRHPACSPSRFNLPHYKLR